MDRIVGFGIRSGKMSYKEDIIRHVGRLISDKHNIEVEPAQREKLQLPESLGDAKDVIREVKESLKKSGATISDVKSSVYSPDVTPFQDKDSSRQK